MARPKLNMTAMTLTDEVGALHLVCTRCTYHEWFRAPDKREAYMRAALKGWLQKLDTLEKKVVAVICPACALKLHGTPAPIDSFKAEAA